MVDSGILWIRNIILPTARSKEEIATYDAESHAGTLHLDEPHLDKPLAYFLEAPETGTKSRAVIAIQFAPD